MILTLAINTSVMKYQIAETKIVFTGLRKTFTKILILQFFDLKYYIRIRINISYYFIGQIFTQLNFDKINLDNLISTKSDFSQ